jgi:hypothetical protein
LYYEAFARLTTIPGLTTDDQSYSAKVLSHLQRHSHIWREHSTNWKRQYKIQYNWARGKCHIKELTVNDTASPIPLITRLCERHIYTLEVASRIIKVWSAIDQRLLGSFNLPDSEILPSALAINPSKANVNEHDLLIGFSNGSFSKLSFDIKRGSFFVAYIHEAKAINATITDIAYYDPYVATFSTTKIFNVYKLQGSPIDAVIISSLQSDRLYSQCTVSLRLLESTLHAAVVFVLPNTWAPIIQESLIHYETGEVLASRLAVAELPHRPFGTGLRHPAHTHWSYSHSQANSISYSYPYIVVPLPDNSVQAYLVKSTATEIGITHYERLIGHTEGVAGARVESSGKAISVGRTARDVWIWQLNELPNYKNRFLDRDAGEAHALAHSYLLLGETYRWARKQREWERLEGDRSSLRIQAKSSNKSGAEYAGYVGFDDESVVVLKTGPQGLQNVAVYDFS